MDLAHKHTGTKEWYACLVEASECTDEYIMSVKFISTVPPSQWNDFLICDALVQPMLG
jgi:hypothetical protein